MSSGFSFQRRKLLTQAGGTLATMAASTLAAPALALSEDFLLKRGDLRIGLLSSSPPYDTSGQNAGITGLLPSVAHYFADELWLTPSYGLLDSNDILLYSPQELFQRNGGLDIIMQAPKDWAEQHGALLSDVYVSDHLSFFAIPDLHEVAMFPTNFYTRKTLAFPCYLVNRMIAYSEHANMVEIDYNVSRNDLAAGTPFEKVINGEFDCFLSSHNQLQWMMGKSTHKFHLNEVYFHGQNPKVEFGVIVSPKSPWILPRINKVLRELVEKELMVSIFEKYHLSTI